MGCLKKEANFCSQCKVFIFPLRASAILCKRAATRGIKSDCTYDDNCVCTNDAYEDGSYTIVNMRLI
jgi:hypothetical protein